MAEHPLFNSSGRLSLSVERGDGIWLYDTQGNRYLDTSAGSGECGLGHAHAGVQEALAHQAGELTYCASPLQCASQRALATKLSDLAGMEGALFAHSGAEANDSAIRIARQFGLQKGITNPAILVAGNEQRGSSPDAFASVPFNDIEAIRELAATRQDVAAIMLETIQGDAGAVIAEPAYLKAVQDICRDQGWLLILDETQSGIGRTGSFFACQQYSVLPDVLTLARGLGNGFPISACLTRGEAAEVFFGSAHASTVGGNPLGCAAALAVISALENDHLVARARALGKRVMEPMRDYLEGAYYVREIRSLGLIIGIELQEPCPELALLAKTQGMLISVTAERVIRLLPALTMTDAEADDMAMRLIRLIKLYMADERKRPRR